MLAITLAVALVAVATETLAQIELSALTVTLIVATVIPIVTGIITKVSAPSWLKGLITLVLNAVNALVVQSVVADGTAVISQETLIAWLIGLTVSVAIYAGVYKPLNVTSSSEDGLLSPRSGIG